MEVLASFLNGEVLVDRISSLMSDIVKSRDDLTEQENKLKKLKEIFEIVPSTFELKPIENCSIFFDFLVERSPTVENLGLLGSTLNLMTNAERTERVETILSKLVDQENFSSNREIFVKLLNKIEISNFSSMKIDWKSVEKSFSVEQNPNLLVSISRFLSKNFPKKFEEIFQGILFEEKFRDENLLFVLVEFDLPESVLSSPIFWLLIQRSLANGNSNDDRIRKSAFFLLQKIVSQRKVRSIRLENQQILFASNDKIDSFWSDYLIIYEALENGVAHLIKPLLTKFDRIRDFSIENGSIEKFSFVGKKTFFFFVQQFL